MDINETLHRIHSKKLYFCDEEWLANEQLKYLDKIFEYNNLKPSKQLEKKKLLKDMVTFYSRIGFKESILFFMKKYSLNFNLITLYHYE